MNRIELYTYLCYACLALCILCLGTAAALFFYYDIRSVAGYLSGSSARKGIKELEAETASSGKLGHKKKTSEKKDKNKKKPLQEVSQNQQFPAVSAQAQQVVRIAEETEKLSAAEVIPVETPQKDMEEATMLEQISFVIEREVLLLHTDEIIS
ncbi:MAG: hypothetical protein HFI80_02220 [Lachnospiraceae bacterium]|jgi:ATPase subunit of ABC transporter with duplicated ATPase domains|nr:hypothetical protein [Lachnospiraceae bacterium]MCI9660352.1 hypothetical protein [Lachnospiraceae bacterium]MDE6906840.1 hypothetical protein [Lachnospiraceae bacterium]